jgi:AcrR family transcriptional regulator
VAVDQGGKRPSSLADERQELTRNRIRRAAMTAVARHGFDTTVEQIAELSGVSPRTIFRHYRSHDRLIAETVRDMFEACGRYPDVGSPREVEDMAAWIDSLPQQVADVDGWLEALAVIIHTRMAEVFGDAFWDIYAPPRPGSEALVAVAELCRAYRLRGMRYMAALAWRSAGGTGEPPEDLTLAFALHLSAHTTQALMTDFGCSPTRVGQLCARILQGLLHDAVAAGSAGSDPHGTPASDPNRTLAPGSTEPSGVAAAHQDAPGVARGMEARIAQ